MPRWGMGSKRGGGIGSNGAAPTRWNAMPVVAWMRDRNAIVEIAPTGQRIPARASPRELQFAPTGQRIPAHGIALGTAICTRREVYFPTRFSRRLR